MVDVEVDKSKGEIERLKEEIRKLEQTKKGEASSKLEELESQVHISSTLLSQISQFNQTM